MPTAALVMPPPLRAGDRLTREEFLRRWDAMPELRQAELIDGVVHMASPVSTAHSDNHFALSHWLSGYAAQTPGVRGGTAGTWLMAADSVPQPDLHLRILPEYGGQSRVDGDYPAGAPELIVEISHTTGSKDAGDKLRLYERSGVREYLMIRPGRKQVIWRSMVRRKYAELTPGDDGLYRSRVFPGLWLNAAALWKQDLAGLTAAVAAGVRRRSMGASCRR